MAESCVRCCQCLCGDQGSQRCVRCICFKNKRPCTSCYPSRSGCCGNAFNSHSADPPATLPCVPNRSNSRRPDYPTVRSTSSSPSQPISQRPPLSQVPLPSVKDILGSDNGTPGHYLESCEIDTLMSTAYGSSLIQHDLPVTSSDWYSRRYVDLLCEEVRHLVQGTYPSERIIIFSAIILQRDKFASRIRDINRVLERRMDLWTERKYDLLVQEAKRCDQPFKRSRLSHLSQNSEHTTKVFTRLMLQGKIRAAMRRLTERSKGSVLSPNGTVSVKVGRDLQSLSVTEALKMKHPESRPPHSSTLLNPSHLPLFEDIEITGAHINIIAHRIQGSAGPGGCDSSHWQDILLRYGSHSSRLRDSIAELSRHLANSIIEWHSLQALLANRLIALDKSPGIRPIGVGETLRRIIGKAICLVTRGDVELACESNQLCAGVKCGIEGAIHSASDLFDSENHGMLLVDARNAFNTINRISLLWNSRILWPRTSRFIFNTYRGWSPLIIKGSVDHLFSREGIVQGDPLSMFMYAVATLPLIQELKSCTNCTQLWYADDSSVIGELGNVRSWFEKLTKFGPYYGYYPEPTKSSLVVRHSLVLEAENIFHGTGVKILTSCRFLGGIIGDDVGKNSFITTKVQEWVQYVEQLSSIAVTQPQAAYIALTKSLQHEWTYLQRVVSNSGHLFEGIESALSSLFIPALFGQASTHEERLLYSLPSKMGGLGIRNPVETASTAYLTSRDATKLLIDSIVRKHELSFSDHDAQVSQSKLDHYHSQQEIYNNLSASLYVQLDTLKQRSLSRATHSLSAWLNTTPIQKDHYDLSANEFRDSLCMRYSKPLLNLPPNCDGCGQLFTTSHALDCRKGGLIIQRHNEIRDLLFDLTSLVWNQVTREPIIQESCHDPPRPALIADVGARGVWQPQATALFDIRVTTDAPSYLRKSPQSILKTAETEKKNKYTAACESCHASFTPLCMSVDGLLGIELQSFLCRLADRLSDKWDKPYSVVNAWTRTKLSFALVRATNLCIRGSRTKWRGLTFEDGSGIIPHHFQTA